MKKQLFKGIATALITPFENGRISYSALSHLIEHQIRNNIDAIVICGTTGESPVLSLSEQETIIKYTIKTANGRVPIIAGIGSNDYQKALHLAEFASKEGADGLLAVTPYYNKATEKGILQYYSGISSVSNCSVIAYNVPSRTGYSITPEIYAKLCAEGVIQGIKEAKNDVAEASRTFSLCGDLVDIYSGNDNLLLPFLSLGASGCISVASNVVPHVMKKIYLSYVNGKEEESRKTFLQYLKLFDGLFSQVNPVPVKRCAELMGLCGGELRLPLTAYEGNGMEKLLKEYRLI